MKVPARIICGGMSESHETVGREDNPMCRRANVHMRTEKLRSRQPPRARGETSRHL